MSKLQQHLDETGEEIQEMHEDVLDLINVLTNRMDTIEYKLQVVTEENKNIEKELIHWRSQKIPTQHNKNHVQTWGQTITWQLVQSIGYRPTISLHTLKSPWGYIMPSHPGSRSIIIFFSRVGISNDSLAFFFV